MLRTKCPAVHLDLIAPVYINCKNKKNLSIFFVFIWANEKISKFWPTFLLSDKKVYFEINKLVSYCLQSTNNFKFTNSCNNIFLCSYAVYRLNPKLSFFFVAQIPLLVLKAFPKFPVWSIAITPPTAPTRSFILSKAFFAASYMVKKTSTLMDECPNI